MTNKIKMQKEHDAKRGMNKPKPKTIMDALNWFKGEVPKFFNQTGNVLIECIATPVAAQDDIIGGIYAGGVEFNPECFRQICTKEEYEAWVEELSRPEKEEPKIYTQAMVDAGELPEVGMRFINTEFGGCEEDVVTMISNEFIISTRPSGGSESCIEICANYHKPIDTRTEKEKVIDGITDLVNRAVNEGECANVVVEAIYDKFIAKK